MAKLPDMTTTERPAPQPSMGVVGYRPDKGGQALMELGVDMQQLAEKMRIEQDKLDTIAAEDALTKLREKQLDLTNGPENGFANVKGEGAIKPDFYTGYRDRFDQAAREIDGGLTDSQRQKFRQRASMARLQFNEGVLRHAAHQGDIYAEQTYKGIVAVETKMAQQSWIDPNAIATSVARVQAANKDLADRLGWSKEVREANEAQALGKLHMTVVEQATAAGSYKYAKDYAEAHKLGDAVIAGIRKDEEQATFDTKSVQGADELLAQTGGDYTKAKQEAMKNPDGKLAKAIRQEIETREVDYLHARNEDIKENLGKGHLMIEQGVSRAALKNSPAYKALDEGSQATLLNAHDARLREKRAEAQGLSEQATKEQWEHYADLVTLARYNPDQFRKLDIKSELWKVPKSLRDNLMTAWQRDPKDTKIESTITYSQQMSAATRDLDKSKRGMFEAAVQQEVMALEAATGKKATATETQQIIDRMLIKRDIPWGADKPSYMLAPAERAKYAPEISKEDRQAIVDKFKQKGNANPTDEEIMGIYKKWKGL